jgi:hypothetical protein
MLSLGYLMIRFRLLEEVVVVVVVVVVVRQRERLVGSVVTLIH